MRLYTVAVCFTLHIDFSLQNSSFSIIMIIVTIHLIYLKTEEILGECKCYNVT